MHWTESVSAERGAGQPCHSAAESCCEFSSQIPPQLTELPAKTFPLVKLYTKNLLKGTFLFKAKQNPHPRHSSDELTDQPWSSKTH